MNRREFIAASAATATTAAAPHPKPNILQILIDDMGYADLGCYDGVAATPHIDRLASEGIRFTQAYVASPVCSPSRVGITTGQSPSRHYIYSYLDSRASHRKRGMRDYLDPAAPSIARTFHDAGYATGHFGKWHMGGGRDVGDAPLPTAYGFDESFTSFEGLGDRVLPPGNLSKASEKLGRGTITHAAQRELTGLYIDRTLAFTQKAKAAGKPFYTHLWLNEVHDAYDPPPDLMDKYARFAPQKYLQQYYATIEGMDRQIGRLLAGLETQGLARDTLIVLLSDNGPTAWPRYYKENQEAPGSTGGLRGRKWSLYEGGVRVPMLARWPGRIPAGRTDERSVISSLDLFPTCCTLAGIPKPKVAFDGEDRSAALFGKRSRRKTDLFWEYGRDASYLKPGLPADQSPNLAMRSDNWKLLLQHDGSQLELYDLAADRAEQRNLAGQQPRLARTMADRLLAWRRSLPALEGAQ